MLKRIKINLKKYRVFLGSKILRWLGVSLFAGLGLAFVEVAFSFLIQALLHSIGVISADEAIPGLVKGFGSLWMVCLLLGFVGVVRSMASFGVLESTVQSSEALSDRLRSLLIYDLLLRGRSSTLTSGQLTYYLSEEFPQASCAVSFFLQSVSILTPCCAIAILMLWFSVTEGSLALIGIGLIAWVIFYGNKRVAAMGDQLKGFQKTMTLGFERVVTNWLPIRILRRECSEHEFLLNEARNYSKVTRSIYTRRNFNAVFAPLLGVLLFIMLIGFSRYIFHSSSVALLSFLYLLIRFVQNLGALVGAIGGFSSYLPALKNAFSYATGFSEEDFKNALGVNPKGLFSSLATSAKPLLRPPSFEVTGVCFSYDREQREILKDISFNVPAGSIFGIQGPSGVGKTTLLGVALGVITPTKGCVRVDGVLASDFFSLYNKHIGYVGAEAFLFRGTIRENLCYGQENAVLDNSCWEVLESVGLKLPISRLPGGLDFVLSEAGRGLSAGEKQRLALARGLLIQPRVLVLDEVSANLDAVSETVIGEAISELRGFCTVLLVSHRPALLRFADTIYMMGEGVVRNAKLETVTNMLGQRFREIIA